MTPEANWPAGPSELLRVRDGLVLHQALYAAAKLGVADLLNDGSRKTRDLATQLEVHESALYRMLRTLASRGIFEETAARTFANNPTSSYLRSGVPGSMRSMVISGEPRIIFAPLAKFSTAFRPLSRPDPKCWARMDGSSCNKIPHSHASLMTR
jgi:hypothetical protein